MPFAMTKVFAELFAARKDICLKGLLGTLLQIAEKSDRSPSGVANSS